MSKLPNLWVEFSEFEDERFAAVGTPERTSPSDTLYVPAARIREILQRMWTQEVGFFWVRDELQSLIDEKEAGK